MIKIKYKGRSLNSSTALIKAIKSDFEKHVENEVRQQARKMGGTVRKTARGYEITKK